MRNQFVVILICEMQHISVACYKRNPVFCCWDNFIESGIVIICFSWSRVCRRANIDVVDQVIEFHKLTTNNIQSPQSTIIIFCNTGRAVVGCIVAKEEASTRVILCRVKITNISKLYALVVCCLYIATKNICNSLQRSNTTIVGNSFNLSNVAILCREKTSNIGKGFNLCLCIFFFGRNSVFCNCNSLNHPL